MAKNNILKNRVSSRDESTIPIKDSNENTHEMVQELERRVSDRDDSTIPTWESNLSTQELRDTLDERVSERDETVIPQEESNESTKELHDIVSDRVSLREETTVEGTKSNESSKGYIEKLRSGVSDAKESAPYDDRVIENIESNQSSKDKIDSLRDRVEEAKSNAPYDDSIIDQSVSNYTSSEAIGSLRSRVEDAMASAPYSQRVISNTYSNKKSQEKIDNLRADIARARAHATYDQSEVPNTQSNKVSQDMRDELDSTIKEAKASAPYSQRNISNLKSNQSSQDYRDQLESDIDKAKASTPYEDDLIENSESNKSSQDLRDQLGSRINEANDNSGSGPTRRTNIRRDRHTTTNQGDSNNSSKELRDLLKERLSNNKPYTPIPQEVANKSSQDTRDKQKFPGNSRATTNPLGYPIGKLVAFVDDNILGSSLAKRVLSSDLNKLWRLPILLRKINGELTNPLPKKKYQYPLTEDEENKVQIINFNASPAIVLTLQHRPTELQVRPFSNWVAVKSMGRNNPFYMYTSGDDTISFEVTWIMDDKDTKEDVISKCRLLEAWSKADGYTAAPPVLKIKWGNSDMFKNDDFILESAPYVLKNFQNYNMAKAEEPILTTHLNVLDPNMPLEVDVQTTVKSDGGLFPGYAVQTLTFKRVSPHNRTLSDIVSDKQTKIATKNTSILRFKGSTATTTKTPN